MKRNWKLMVCLLAALFALTACSGTPSGDDIPDIPQSLGPASVPATLPQNDPEPNTDTFYDPEIDPATGTFYDPEIDPATGTYYDPEAAGSVTGGSIFAENPYLQNIPQEFPDEFTAEDALGEENYIDPEFGVVENPPVYQPDPYATVYPYAGSTPIPLNPVDMPTPTPKPDLSFNYTQYIANTAGVTFEGPVGWQANESQAYMFILSEPAGQVKDGQACTITISAEPIGANYDKGDLETHVEHRLDTIGGTQFTEFKPSYTATRHMMGSTGVYANYSGTLTDGTEVGGRIHYVSIDGTLYGLEIVFPEGFRDDFIELFGEIRKSMKRI